MKPVPGGKPAPAFKMFLGGCDALGAEQFGEAVGVVYEEQLPALLVELGKAAAAAGQTWQDWRNAHGEELQTILAKYC